MSDLPPNVRQGEQARLIPVAADTRREQRVTSTVLAVLSAVDEFGYRMLKSVGAPIGKSSKIACFTEIVFDSESKNSNHRPDGLIVIQRGKRNWTALVEAKIGRSVLDKEQIESYLDIARKVGADAVITISNQFATRPTHHPITVNKSKLRSVGLYHWSWSALLTEALLCEAESAVTDRDQAFILHEMIRYLNHDNSGVVSFERMPATWKDICAVVQQDAQLTRNSPGVSDVIISWHELTRFLALNLSVGIGHAVSVHLPRTHVLNPEKSVQDDTASLISDAKLTAEFDVPDAAARIQYSADLARRTLTTSMTLDAPKDRARPLSLCTWILKQVEACTDDNLIIVAKWLGRTADTMATLGQMREDRAAVLGNVTGQMPTAFEVRQVLDLGGRFKGVRTFVEGAKQALPSFYEHAGQNLQAWVAKPPKMKAAKQTDEEADDEISHELIAEKLETEATERVEMRLVGSEPN